MDISNHDHKLPNSNWDIMQPYNMAMEAHNMLDNHHHHHEIIPFDHTQWPNYPPLPQNLTQPSNSTPTHLLPPPQNPPYQPDDRFKLEIGVDKEDGPEEELGAMKEMMYKIAAMQPVDIDPSTIRKPKRRNVRISDDPQSIAARHRRERISEKIRILQRLVPGGTKMDTASMLDEAIRYVKFLKRQIRVLQGNNNNNNYYPANGAPEVGPTSAGDEDWAGTSSYNVFGGNNNVNDGSISHDGPICFSNKFIGHD